MILRFLLIILVCGVAACAYTPAPVEERDTRRISERLTADGHYLVKRGDTLHAIAFGLNLDWRNLAEWNDIRAPYLIYPEQKLRLSPPAVVTRAAAPRVARTRPLDEPVVTRPAPPPEPQAKPATGEAATGPEPTATPAEQTTAQVTAAEPVNRAAVVMTQPTEWLWPAEGRIVSTFSANDSMRKGIDIGGREGQPIRATAPGKVVYSGSGLIGYGELIIIKHSESMLSAYAHNRKRLVTEGQDISAGQLIAEMGRNDRNQQILHFEMRRNGVPEDPLKYLSGR